MLSAVSRAGRGRGEIDTLGGIPYHQAIHTAVRLTVLHHIIRTITKHESHGSPF